MTNDHPPERYPAETTQYSGPLITGSQSRTERATKDMARLALALAVAHLEQQDARPVGMTRREHIQYKDEEAAAQIRREHELRKRLNFLRRLPKNVRPIAADGDEALPNPHHIDQSKDRPDRSIIWNNAKRDPTYSPYCMKCPGLVRMLRVGELQWQCHRCGAQHQEAP